MRPPFYLLTRASLFVVLAVALALLGRPAPASAAEPILVAQLSARVTGSSVTSTLTLTSASTAVTTAAVCVRDANGGNHDFAGSGRATILPSGLSVVKTASFPPGVYRYTACVQVDGDWRALGGSKTFTVADGDPGEDATGSPSNVSMPVGNLPGWQQVLSEDFNSPVVRGGFPGPYSEHWTSYDGFPNTSKRGDYDQSIISAHDGTLDLYLHAENGRPLGAAPAPLLDGDWGGQSYGRYSSRMKADAADGYGVAFLLWSDADNWDDGEIDFPESGLDDVIRGYNHCPGSPEDNCLVYNGDARYTSWHTYTIDWRPESLSFLVDGQVVKTTTKNIPSKPLHWVMQVETPDPAAAVKSTGHILIDWVTIYSVT